MDLNKVVSDFETNGYVLVEKLVAQSRINTLFENLDAICAHSIVANGHSVKGLDTVDKKWLFLKENLPDVKSRTYDLMKHLDAVNSIANDENVIKVTKALAKAQTILVDNVLVRMDDFANDRMRPYHQEGLGQISYDSFNFWMPLVPVNKDIGSIKIIPNSHKQGMVPHKFYKEMGNYHGVREEFLTGWDGELVVDAKPGDALFFHPCLYHGSAPMLVDKYMRWTLIVRYNALRNIPYLTDMSAPKHIPQVE